MTIATFVAKMSSALGGRRRGKIVEATTAHTAAACSEPAAEAIELDRAAAAATTPAPDRMLGARVAALLGAAPAPSEPHPQAAHIARAAARMLGIVEDET